LNAAISGYINSGSAIALPAVKREEHGRHQATTGGGMVPAQMLAKVVCDEDAEDDQRDDLLDHLELDGRKAVCAKPVRGHLQAVLKKGDAPADEDDLP